MRKRRVKRLVHDKAWHDAEMDNSRWRFIAAGASARVGRIDTIQSFAMKCAQWYENDPDTQPIKEHNNGKR